MSAAEQTGEQRLAEIVEIPRDAGVRIARARGQMPYGALVHASTFVEIGPHPDHTIDGRETPTLLDVDGLALYLEQLAAVLSDHAAADRERDSRLDRLETLIRFGRDLVAELTGEQS